jgi:hypothetical protein
MNTSPPWTPPLRLDSSSDWGHVRDANGDLICIVRTHLDDPLHIAECRRSGIDPAQVRAQYIIDRVAPNQQIAEKDAQIAALNQRLTDAQDSYALYKIRLDADWAEWGQKKDAQILALSGTGLDPAAGKAKA